ncbi:MAG: UvrD-helicase domain-containing protein, partial [Verrucomicrobia bacterium]|nr:UvrD-helicase domain-containing protein [Verrucomicrobiota bacterium]
MSAFTPQQSEAITASGNVLVVAGAGTGKTHTLISRCLRLVTEERVSIENVLMVTFTEAAAAEMRARLRSGLQTLHFENPEDEHLAEQLALLDTARISTLHGFCLQLLREHFHALGLDPQFSVLDEQQTRPLQREALDEILERHYLAPADTDPVQKLIRVLGRGSDEGIRKLVVKLHSFTQSLARPEAWMRQQELYFAKTQPDKWRNSFIEAVMTVRTEWLAEIRQHQGTAAVDISIEALEQMSKQPAFTEAADLVRLIHSADKDKKKNWPRGSIGKVRDLIKAFFEEVEFLAALTPVEKQDPLSDDWSWCREQMLALLSLVREFGVVFAGKKRELGGVDFSDMEQSSLRMLCGDDGAVTPVALEWQGRLAHVVVDEYQDINAAQDAILAALSRTGVDANRFLVGDAKQSIYRFRLANPGIFQAYHRAWSDGNAGRSLSLTQNFRSRAAILNFVNGLFGSLMREEVGGVNYESLQFGDESSRIAISTKPGDSKCVELHIIAKSDEEADEAEDEAEDSGTATPDLPGVEREARLVARRLRELKEGKHQVWDKNSNCFRDVKWNDMAVLLRSPNGRAEAFAMEFNRAGIPLSAARDGFFSSLEVSDLLNLLKLLDNPLQDVPLVAVLRSPLVGLTLEELARIRAGAGRELFWTSLLKWRDVMRDAWCVNEQLETRAIPHAPRTTHHALLAKIDTFVESIHRWRELVRQTSLSQTLETALVETHYESLLLAGEHGVERAANVRRLLDLARQFDPYQRQGLHRFLKFIRLQEDEEFDLQPAAAPTDDAVRLMSVHKSKGLEFPVVVLASLGTNFNEQDLRGAVLFNEQHGLCPRITPPGSEESYQGLTHWMARRTEKRELRGEELRLLYVATTRARDHLILVGTANSKAADVFWPVAMDLRIGTSEALSARSHLGWLLRWMPSVTSSENWKDDRTGENDLLRW